MVLNIYIFISIFLIPKMTVNGESSCPPNVRTVIFHESDLHKDCWHSEEMALLIARQLMQESLPKKVSHNIPLMIEYFKDSLKTVREIAPPGKPYMLMYSALADTIGGYLQAYGLPITNLAYYEGNLNYDEVKELHDLQDSIKKTLGTDGGGWVRPIEVKKTTNPVLALRISNQCKESACKNIITNNEVRSNHETGHIQTVVQELDSRFIQIPLPFLDDYQSPSSIAVPFRERALYSLKHKSSCYVLVKYYIESIECLNAKRKKLANNDIRAFDDENRKAVFHFQQTFYNWLATAIIPHLRDETWYPGFGSVLRIVETMRQKGVNLNPEIPVQKPETCPTPEDSDLGLELLENTNTCQVSPHLFVISIACLIFILLFWTLVLICYLLHRIGCLKTCCRPNKKSDVDTETCQGTSSESLRATMFTPVQNKGRQDDFTSSDDV